MEGFSLRFYMHSRARKSGMPLHVWLLEQARTRGFAGSSTFQAIEGYGRHDTILHANRVLSWDAPRGCGVHR
ncbi:DUF190 domain-containing protein [Luteibacter sp. CQ10]|uniref:DUF190 domain-containing protein n=1 Tax=Luteibacter sp. CQ10 TaxID=2805821 RepID=UPI0034A2BDF2